ncbi:hypothetical protein PBI_KEZIACHARLES14_40 [Mycobacterium phage Keziacharles14]|nr:hypothetical protein PBI_KEZIACHARLES14_40 [Mycobacterium phage Keziacharles14]
MADHGEFFDELYQQWSKTTGAKDTYWMVEEDRDEHIWYAVIAFNPSDESKTVIGRFHEEADADFVAGLNGAIPDLIRHLGEATDRADRLDEARDRAEGIAADALLETAGLKEQIRDLEQRLDLETLPPMRPTKRKTK